MIRNNPYGLRVKLNVEAMSVDVEVIDKKADDGKGKVVESDTFPASAVDAKLHKNVALYGYSKLLQDRSSDVPTGPGKLAAMREVAAMLATGEWEKERKVGAPVVSAEVEALARIKKCSVSDIQTALRRYSKENRDKILSSAQVKEIAAVIRAEREAATVEFSDFGVEPEAAAAA